MITLYENATHILITGPDHDLETLRQHFKYRPNNYFRSPKYERWQATGGEDGWDGYLYPLRIISDGVARVLRGYRVGLLHACEQNGLEVNTRKLLDCPFARISLEDVPPDLVTADFQLDNYQRRSIQQLLVYGNGVIQATVGAGKTGMFAGCAAMIKARYPDARFIYMTPTERLVRQSYKEMKRFLPNFDISQFGGGKSDNSGKDMVVCTVAMLNRHFRNLKASRWFDTHICILFDEVQHACSETAQKILLAIPAAFRFGASDSRKIDDPSKFNAILGHFGPMLSETSASPLIQAGRLVRPHHYLVDMPEWHNRYKSVPFKPQPGTEAVVLQGERWVKGVYKGPIYELNRDGKIVYKTRKVLDDNKEWIEEEIPVTVPGVHLIELRGQDEPVESRWCLLDRMYDRAIVRFGERNNLIVEWAVHFSKQDFTTLVVCKRTLHVYILESLIMKAHPRPELVRILFGWASSKERDKTFEWFAATPGAVLISPLVQEGVSIPQIRAAIVADVVSDFERANQITGRVIRSAEGKEKAEMVWFIERQHPAMRRGSVNVFSELEKIHGYVFFTPCAGPESVNQALEFRAKDLDTAR